jgi:hypothetical protein
MEVSIESGACGPVIALEFSGALHRPFPIPRSCFLISCEFLISNRIGSSSIQLSKEWQENQSFSMVCSEAWASNAHCREFETGGTRYGDAAFSQVRQAWNAPTVKNL